MTGRKRITTIVIHCSATPPSRNIGAAEIRRWHTEERRWSDIGYHHVIPRSGEIQPGRDPQIMGAHVSGHNRESIGICLVGGVDAKGRPASNFTRSQWSKLERLVRAYLVIWPNAKVIGHNELSAKACPSFDVQAWLKARGI